MNEPKPVPIDQVLLHATVKWNTLMFAGICAVLGALTLLAATYLSLLRGLPQPGHYLSLLGVFLPGYRVSAGGAWVGFFWGGVIGAVSGAIMYRIYARSIPRQVAEYFAGARTADDLEFAVLRLDGHALGLALGGMAALGLLATTNWLVIRGTADESEHAMLLSQYLPGYSVSLAGSLIGAVQMLILAYVFSWLLAAIYNGVAGRRRKAAAP